MSTLVQSSVISQGTAKDRLAVGLRNAPESVRSGRRVHAPTLGDFQNVSIEKHTGLLRFKIAWSAHKVADELMRAASLKNKKDKEYLKGLVWSLGVLYDKIAGTGAEIVSVRIPSQLLDNVKLVIAAQIERREQRKASVVSPGSDVYNGSVSEGV